MAIDERELFEAVQLDMSPVFRRRLERALLEASSAVAEREWTTALGRGPAVPARPTMARRRWVTASAAALVVAVTAAITVIRLQDAPGVDRVPSPTTAQTAAATSTTTSTKPSDTTPTEQQQPAPPVRRAPFTSSLRDVHAIDLDPWLTGAPPWSVTDRDGPYMVFDLQQLPQEWSVVSVEGSHPLPGDPYVWSAHLRSTKAVEVEVRLDLAGGFVPVGSTPTTIRGHDGLEGTDGQRVAITWSEGRLPASLSSTTPSAELSDLHALAESLVPATVAAIGPAPPWPPAGGGISFDVGPPEMGGSIGGHTWTVDTGDMSTTRALYPRVDGVLLGGIDSLSADPPPGYPYGIDTTAVIGGVMVLAIVPSEVDHAVARLSDGSEIVIAGYHWSDRTGIVVPIPHGLDVTSIDLDSIDGEPLHRIDIPEYPPIVSGQSQMWIASLDPPTG